MRMKRLKKRFGGQTLLEVLLALGLLAAIATAGISLSLRYIDALARANDFKTVSAVSQEGFEAVESIARGSWETLTQGTYGLNKGSIWALQAEPDIVDGRFTRTLEVADVNRDSSCQITAGDGVVDPETKQVTLTIEWTTSGRDLSASASKYFSNWSNDPDDLCASTEAGNLIINVDGAVLDNTKKQVEGIVLENTSSVDVTIDELTIAWIKCELATPCVNPEDYTSPGNTFSIKINASDVWHSSNGIGSPTGVQPSGTTIDIVDVVIPANTTYPLDRIRFDSKLDGSQFTITATMGDASQTEVTTDSFLP